MGGKIGLLEIKNQMDYVREKPNVFFFRILVYRENVNRKIAISLVNLVGLKSRNALHQRISLVNLESDILYFFSKPTNIFYFVSILVIT